ncbi:MAG: S8 family serine peptidase [Cocleimonas sp.]
MKPNKKLSAIVFIFIIAVVSRGTSAENLVPANTVQLAGNTVSSNRVIVRFKNNRRSTSVVAQNTSLFSDLGLKITETIQIDEGVTTQSGEKQNLVFTMFSLDGRKDLKTVLKTLNDLPSVQYAEPDFIRSINAQPNDADFSQLWGLDNNGQENGLIDADVDAPETWDTTTGSPNNVIGVIDTGVDYTHEDLAANMWVNPGEIPDDGIDNDGNGYIDDIHGIDCAGNDTDPMDDNNDIREFSHGTHVGGTIGAVGNNGIGISGINWNTKIMALKIFGEPRGSTDSVIIECIAYAVNMKNNYGIDIRITNNSWGGGPFSQALKDTIQASANANMLFVAAAGNDSNNNDINPSYPASYNLDNIIAVANTTRTDNLALDSNFGGATVDLGAPGTGILSTIPGNQYGLKNGTSMASPHVAGAAALLWSDNPSLSVLEVKNRLISQGDLVADLTGTTASGRRLNINAALNCRPGSPKLEILAPLNQFLLFAEDEVVVKANIQDCGTAITNIDVLAIPGNGDASFTLLDDGQGVDNTAGDGIYTGIWQIQNPGESVILTVNADSLILTDSISGEVLAQPYRLNPEHPFEWIDATSGTRLDISNEDDKTETIAIGFDFEFYGVPYSQVNIDSNGFLTFDNDNNRSHFSNRAIPSNSQPNGFIAPYWDDIDPRKSQTGNIYTLLEGSAPNQRLTIAWVETPLHNVNADSPVTFEVTLYEGSNEIIFQYGDDYMANSATIGIEHQSGDFGLQYLFNGVNDGEPVQILNEQAIRFFTDNSINFNQNPTVDTGADQITTLPNDVILQGTVTDDGLPNPPGIVTSTWSQVSGPGTVIFVDANVENTKASFDLAGTYVLRLTADDSEFTAFDEITITVNPATSSTIVETRISTSSDDAEEDTATGRVNRGSSDLELVDQRTRNQLVGMRFNNLAIPQGAIITNASIQFQVDEAHSGTASLMIEGEATDSALTFTSANGNISSRVLTGAAVDWTPVPWTTVGEAGSNQQTPDITSIIQEIVDRSGWSTGNSLAVIISGTGQRVAESFNGDSAAAPLLRVEFTAGNGINQPPTVDAGSNQTINLPNDVALDGTVTDDGQPTPPGTVTNTWSQISGPGTVIIVDANSESTSASFDLAGTYPIFRL